MIYEKKMVSFINIKFRLYQIFGFSYDSVYDDLCYWQILIEIWFQKYFGHIMNYSEYSVPTQKRSEIETSHQFVSAAEKAVGKLCLKLAPLSSRKLAKSLVTWYSTQILRLFTQKVELYVIVGTDSFMHSCFHLNF